MSGYGHWLTTHLPSLPTLTSIPHHVGPHTGMGTLQPAHPTCVCLSHKQPLLGHPSNVGVWVLATILGEWVTVDFVFNPCDWIKWRDWCRHIKGEDQGLKPWVTLTFEILEMQSLQSRFRKSSQWDRKKVRDPGS